MINERKTRDGFRTKKGKKIHILLIERTEHQINISESYCGKRMNAPLKNSNYIKINKNHIAESVSNLCLSCCRYWRDTHEPYYENKEAIGEDPLI